MKIKDSSILKNAKNHNSNKFNIKGKMGVSENHPE